MHSKGKIPDSWRTGWKAKACTSFVLYLKVFKNHLYYLWHNLVRVLSIKPCLHTQLREHNKSYRKVSRGWGHLITWYGPMLGHLNSFYGLGRGEFEQEFSKNSNVWVLPGRGGNVEASIWLVHKCHSVCSNIWEVSFVTTLLISEMFRMTTFVNFLFSFIGEKINKRLRLSIRFTL